MGDITMIPCDVINSGTVSITNTIEDSVNEVKEIIKTQREELDNKICDSCQMLTSNITVVDGKVQDTYSQLTELKQNVYSIYLSLAKSRLGRFINRIFMFFTMNIVMCTDHSYRDLPYMIIIHPMYGMYREDNTRMPRKYLRVIFNDSHQRFKHDKRKVCKEYPMYNLKGNRFYEHVTFRI